MARRGNETPWEAVKELGAAIAAEREPSAAFWVAARRLAVLCDAAVALWGAIDSPDRLRLLAASPPADGADGQMIPPVIPAPHRADGRQLAAFAALPRALAGRSPVVGTEQDGQGAYLAVPLAAQGRVWGVALARAAQPVDDLLACCGPLEALAPLLGLLLAGAARDVAWPSERSGGQAGGGDWPQLRDVVERELARARRDRSSCAVVLVDLDPVEVAREQSEPALDEEVLQAMLRLLRATCRAMDVVSRYGADQFLALLPGSDGRGARLVADRFLRQLYLSPVGLPPDRSGYLHATIGIAAFPVDGFTADELLATASTALFEQRRAAGSRQ